MEYYFHLPILLENLKFKIEYYVHDISNQK